jgi:dephospho-CoA kinase
MFQTRRIQVEAVQCMACGRYRVDGLWLHQDIHAHEVSHTFCPDCVPAVREGLLREREFRQQSFDRQVEMLREELIRHPLDEDGLRKRLESLQAPVSALEALVEGVRDLLLQCQCRYCGQVLLAGQKRISRMGYQLHEGCSQKLAAQVQEMQKFQASEDTVDAYLDILQVPHDVRDGMKILLKD